MIIIRRNNPTEINVTNTPQNNFVICGFLSEIFLIFGSNPGVIMLLLLCLVL
jgi:hypothetical protein